MVLKSDRKDGQIFSIRLNSTSISSVLAFVKYRIRAKRKFYLVTPNPEIVLASTNDQDLVKALNRANLSLPDGIGLAQASRFLSLAAPTNKILRFFVCLLQGLIVGGATFLAKDWLTDSLNILPGRGVFISLITLANENSWRVFLLGGYEGVSGRAAAKLARKYKKIKFAFANGPTLNQNGEPDIKVDSSIQKVCVEKINQFKPQLLFVAFGPPKQEKWIAKNLAKLTIGGAMTVGGTFNYVAGEAKLPPKWMQDFGLEWVWRLVTEPWRVRRILNAFPIFPLAVFWSKLSGRE